MKISLLFLLAVPAAAQIQVIVPGGQPMTCTTITYSNCSGGPQAVAPAFTPDTGTYAPPISVSIASATPAAAICWTNDGSNPTADGEGGCTHGSPYTGPITLPPTTRVVQPGSGIPYSSPGPSPRATVSITPGMTTAQIQTALTSAPAGATVSFAQGNYSITSGMTVPCSNLQLTGPSGNTPTAILAATFLNNTILSYPGNCANLGSIRNLGFTGTGAVYFGQGNNSNFIFTNNSVTKLPSAEQTNYFSEAGLLFDGNMNTTLSNVTVRNNLFGDSSSCAAIFADANDLGGFCAGVLTFEGQNNNIDIEYNNFVHLEEPVHINQLVNGWNPGQPASVCIACTVSNNAIYQYHRIAIEVQTGTPTNSVMIEHNSVVDAINSSYGTFAISMACCQWSWTMGTPGYSPGYVFNDNVLVSSQPCGAKCPPIGVEFWGTGSQGQNSLVEGTFANGYTWGFGAAPWTINNNYICGPNYTSQGGYSSNQQGQANPPAQSGNVTGPTCSTRTSATPTIAPNGGTFTGTTTVVLAASGNTGIWYTTDGSTPVPGTAKFYSAPITLSATTTIKAIGMWGNQIQPTTYPSGYGYVPSSVVTATFTSSGAGPTPPAPVTLKAVASKPGFTDSTISTATYTFQSGRTQ